MGAADSRIPCGEPRRADDGRAIPGISTVGAAGRQAGRSDMGRPRVACRRAPGHLAVMGRAAARARRNRAGPHVGHSSRSASGAGRARGSDVGGPRAGSSIRPSSSRSASDRRAGPRMGCAAAAPRGPSITALGGAGGPGVGRAFRPRPCMGCARGSRFGVGSPSSSGRPSGSAGVATACRAAAPRRAGGACLGRSRLAAGGGRANRPVLESPRGARVGSAAACAGRSPSRTGSSATYGGGSRGSVERLGRPGGWAVGSANCRSGLGLTRDACGVEPTGSGVERAGRAIVGRSQDRGTRCSPGRSLVRTRARGSRGSGAACLERPRARGCLVSARRATGRAAGSAARRAAGRAVGHRRRSRRRGRLRCAVRAA